MSARGAIDCLAAFVAVSVILLVFVNALGLQKVSKAARASPPATQKSVAPVPAAAPLPQPRPEPASGRSRTDLLRDVQQELASRGYYDGGAGPRLGQAIRDFELAQRLRVTGEASEILLGQIRKARNKSDITGSIGPSKPAAANPQVIFAQRLLARYGYGPIHMNGSADRETHEAVERFERDRNMPATGEISARLLRELAAFSGGALD